jgi:hypothetical protein
MEASPSWEANSCLATREIPSISWNPDVRYHVHNNPSLFPMLRRMNPVLTSSSFSVIFILIVSSLIRLGLPTGLFPSDFPARILNALLSHACYNPCPFHPPWLDHSNYIWRYVQVMKLLIVQFLFLVSYYFIPLGSKHSPQHPVLKRPLSVVFL